MPAVQTTNTPTFETVWAALQETDRIIKENQKENAVQMKEYRESQKETDRILTEKGIELNARIGSLTNLFGDFTVGMIAPKLREKFTDYGFVFPKSSLNFVIEDHQNNICLEVDILLENGDKAMLVEIKTKLTADRIIKHIERLEKMRKYADLHSDKRTFVGAIAGFAIADDVRKNALNQGFYLIEPDGENFNIIPPNSKPKEW